MMLSSFDWERVRYQRYSHSSSCNIAGMRVRASSEYYISSCLDSY